MDCSETEKNIPDLIAGELPESEKRRVERHIKDCPSCRRRMEELRDVWLTLGSLERIHFPSALSRRVMEEITPPRPRSRRPRPFRLFSSRPVLALAASLLLLAGIYFIFRRAPAPDDAARLIVSESATTFRDEGVPLPDPRQTLERYLSQSRNLFQNIAEERYDDWGEVLSDIIKNDLQGQATFLLEEPSLPAAEMELIRGLHDSTWRILKVGRGREGEKVEIPETVEPVRLIEAIDRYRSDRETFR